MTANLPKRDAVIAAMPGTTQQIAKKAGATGTTVQLWVSRMHAAGEYYIQGWRRTSGRLAPRYALGNAPDKEKPPRMTQKEYNRRNYVRNYQADLKEARAVRKLARANADQMARAPQPWFAALPGSRAIQQGATP